MAASPPIRYLMLLVTLSAPTLVACSDAVEPPARRVAVNAEGTVVDATGAPVAGAYAVLRVATSTKDSPGFGDAPYAVTGIDGRYAVARAGLAGSVDSVTVEVFPPGCSAPPSSVTLEGRLLPVDHEAPVEIDVTADPVSLPARAEPGELCAAGAEPFWGVRSFELILRLESTNAGVLSGTWGLYYNRTSVGPEGLFDGVMGNGLLALQLEPDQASAPVCGGARLAIPVNVEGEWGPAEIVVNNECIPGTAPLTFTRSGVP